MTMVVRQEKVEPELTLTVRADGVSLQTHGAPGEVTQRVLRALELGGPPVMVAVDPGTRDTTVLWAMTEHGVKPLGTAATEHEPHQDDEALVETMLRAYLENAGPPSRSMRAVLAHLRAQGLMRDPAEDGGNVFVQRVNMLRSELEVSKAQVRALTAKADEANTDLASLRESFEPLQADLNAARAALEAEGRKAIQASEREAATRAHLDKALQSLAMEQSNLKAAQARIEALENRQAEDAQAHEAHRG